MTRDRQNRIHAHHQILFIVQRIQSRVDHRMHHLAEIWNLEALGKMLTAAAHQDEGPQEGRKIRYSHIHAVRRRNHVIAQVAALFFHFFKIGQRLPRRFRVGLFIDAHSQCMNMRYVGPHARGHCLFQHILITAHPVRFAFRVVIPRMRSEYPVVFLYDF